MIIKKKKRRLKSPSTFKPINFLTPLMQDLLAKKKSLMLERAVRRRKFLRWKLKKKISGLRMLIASRKKNVLFSKKNLRLKRRKVNTAFGWRGRILKRKWDWERKREQYRRFYMKKSFLKRRKAIVRLKQKYLLSKKPKEKRKLPLKKLLLDKLYYINILSTKTNHFCSITTFFKGHVLFLQTPRMQGFRHTMRRKDTALQATLYLLFKKFSEAYPHKSPRFIVQFLGRKAFLAKKVLRFLSKKLRMRRQILFVKMKQNFAHNGCRLEIRKRKKRKRKFFRIRKRRSRSSMRV